MILNCENCKKPFEGRSNRKTCSVRCRRTLENKRRFWDGKFAYIQWCQIQADWDLLPEQQRKNWQKEADVERKKLIDTFGERP